MQKAESRTTPESGVHESDYRTLFKVIDQGYCLCEMICDDDGHASDYRFLAVNPVFSDMTGLPQSAVGQTARALVPGLEDRWVETYARVGLGGETLRFVEGSAAMGREFDVFATPVGPRGHFALVFSDVTTRRRAESALAASAARDAYRVALSDALRPLSNPLDAQFEAARVLGERVSASRVAYFEVVGEDFVVARDYVRGVPPLVGRYPIASFGPKLLAAYRTGRSAVTADVRSDSDVSPAERAAFAAIQIVSFIGIPLVKNGEFVAGLAVHDAGPRVWDADEVLLAEETAERTWAAVERTRAEEALREADRRKNEFLATLAHELRNPLAPLRTGVALLRRAGADAAMRSRMLDMVERQVDQMVRLIDDLMDVSRISTGRIDLQWGALSLRQLLDDALDASRPALIAAAHTLTFAAPANEVALNADRARVVQILANLLNNAAKYTPHGGAISLSATVEGHDLVLRVGDNGVGIPEDKQRSLFEMFSQVQSSLDRSAGGLGIGLNLVKRLAELHGGSVSVHSDGAGQGSLFVVRLPVVVDSASAPLEASPAEEPADVRHHRVLVVDDNVDGAASLALLLEQSGCITRTAFDGEAALAAARAFRPDVVLLDIGLPKMNGYGVARALRSAPWGRDLILLAITGWGQEDDRQRARAAGFDRHLVKPVNANEVLIAIRALSRRDS